MKPKKTSILDNQMDLFRSQLRSIIDLKHSLVKLGTTFNSIELDEAFGSTFCHDNGRAGIPTRLMVALHYLKFTYDLSDRQALKSWIENPY